MFLIIARFIELRSELVTEMEIMDTSVEFLALNSKYTCITIDHSFENVLKRLLLTYILIHFG